MTLAEKATDAIRMALIDGTFRAGSSLTEREASELLGMSRSPVRTAFQTLANEGFLIYEPNCGYRIRGVSADTVADAYIVRAALEGLACRLLARRGLAPEAQAALEASVAHGRLLLDTPDTSFHHDEWREMNRAFHETILEAADNESLSIAHHTATRHPMTSTMFIPTMQSEPDFPLLQTAQRDHEQILASLCSGDGARATWRMQEHIETASDLVVQHLMASTQNPGTDHAQIVLQNRGP